MIPAEAWHPWEFVVEELQERGWTLDDLAARMGGEFEVNRLTLDFLEHSKEELGIVMGIETSEALGRAFGTSPEFWMNLQTAYDLTRVRAELRKRPSTLSRNRSRPARGRIVRARPA